MSYKVLYRKYRPGDFDNVVGQDYTVDLLKKAIITGKNSHAYIFTGPRGTGKTSCAKLFAKVLNCENPISGNPCGECISCTNFSNNPDIIEMDAASNNSVEDIRDIVDSVKLVPSISKFKIYIIDEVHMLSTGAFNSLLLTLEEPPEHVIFILATTDIQKVPITILSRCQKFDFKPISNADIVSRLKYVCEQENIKYDDDGLEEIGFLSNGGMRDALGMLDQLSSDSDKVTYDLVSSYFGSVSSRKIQELFDKLVSNDALGVVSILDEIKASGTNIVVLNEKIVSELRKYAVDLKSGKVKESLPFDLVISLMMDLNDVLSDSNIRIDAFVLLEIVLLKYINFPGNNLGNNLVSNSNDTVSSKVSFDNSVNVLDSSSKYNGKEVSKVNEIVKKVEVINSNSFEIDIDRRIINCFSEVQKSDKENLVSVWNDFLSDIKVNNKSLYGLLKDTVIQAASSRYSIISAKSDSTNCLINSSVFDIEKKFNAFSGLNYRFVAVSLEKWKEVSEKYRVNRKNPLEYIYVEEDLPSVDNTEVIHHDSSDIESVGSDVFGDDLLEVV